MKKNVLEEERNNVERMSSENEKREKDEEINPIRKYIADNER